MKNLYKLVIALIIVGFASNAIIFHNPLPYIGGGNNPTPTPTENKSSLSAGDIAIITALGTMNENLGNMNNKLNNINKSSTTSQPPAQPKVEQTTGQNLNQQNQMSNVNQLPPTTWQWIMPLVDIDTIKQSVASSMDYNKEHFTLYVDSENPSGRIPFESEVSTSSDAVYHSGAVYNSQDTTKGTTSYGSLARDGHLSILEGPADSNNKKDYILAYTRKSDGKIHYVFIGKNTDGIDLTQPLQNSDITNVRINSEQPLQSSNVQQQPNTVQQNTNTGNTQTGAYQPATAGL